MILKRILPIAIAIAVGLLTLVGLLLASPLSALLLQWGSFLAAVALLLGVLNLLAVHTNRLLRGNVYSAVLVLSLVSVLVLAVTDGRNLTPALVPLIFEMVQFPLEAALASLLAFFLLFAGFQLLRRQRTAGAFLFLLTVIVMLLSGALATTRLLPDNLGALFSQIRSAITAVIVTAGVRGILIGVALGTVTLSLRLLVGAERPYTK
jgi:hypothetical protein